MAVRLTQDNKRGGKNGVFNPAHNDHGKAEMMGGLWFRWTMYDNDDEVRAEVPDIEFVDPDFVDVEKLFYDEYCGEGLAAQNEVHIKGGHKNRCKTMDEYRTSKNTCPESSEYYLGDMKNHEDPDTLLLVVTDFIRWRNERFPLVYTLNLAGHTEDGAPHMVDRHAWTAHDEAGNVIICQEKSLEEMGVPRADEAKYQADMAEAAKIEDPKERRKKISQINRFNNRKMTYTAECREKLVEIAKSYGVEIITEPRKPGKNSISQAQHILADTQKQLADTKEQLTTTQAQLAAAQAAQDKIKEETDQAKQERDQAQADRDAAREDERTAHQNAQEWANKAYRLKQGCDKLQTAREATRAALQGDYETWANLTPKPGAMALLGVLGAAVEASRAKRPPMSPGIGGAYARMMAMVHQGDAQDAAGRDDPELG